MEMLSIVNNEWDIAVPEKQKQQKA